MTTLGLGGAPIGNLYTAVAPETAAATIHEALRLGFAHLDTAPHYGLGLSERRLGEALTQVDVRDVVVSTKVGRLLVPNPDRRDGGHRDGEFDVPATLRRVWDYSPGGLRRSLEESLQRLRLDKVQVLYLHDPDVFGLDIGIERALPVLHALRAEGLTDRIGIGSIDTHALERCVAEADLDIIMCAGRYTLLEQPAAARLLPLCLQRGVAVAAAGVYNSGALATATMPDAVRYDYLPAPPAVIDRLRALHGLCAVHGVTVPQVAVQFVARHPAVEVVVLGARSPAEVRMGHDNAHAPVPDALWADLAGSGLLQQDP